MVSRRQLSKAAGPEDPVTQERQVAAVILAALEHVAEELPASVIETADPVKIFDAIDWADVAERLMGMQAPLERAIVRFARDEIPDERLAKADVGFPIDFGLVNELAVNYSAQHSGRLVVEISSKMRETINTVVTGTVATTMPRSALTKVLRSTIPLHSAWASAVDKAAGRAYESAMQGGASVTTAQRSAEKVAQNRARALSRRRAENIARTEVMTAANEGKYAAWNEQVANGWAATDSLKEWLEGRTPCELCAPVVGEIVPWDQPFSNGRMMPPLHPSCRCSAALLPPDEEYLEMMERQQSLRRTESLPGSVFADATESEMEEGRWLSVHGAPAKRIRGVDRDGLTPVENAAVSDYVAGWHAREVNRGLRAGTAIDAEITPDWISAMDRAVNAGRITGDRMLYRGVSFDLGDLKSYTPGAVVEDLGYVSTSASLDTVQRWNRKTADGWVLKIRARDGQAAGAGFAHLDEAILPRGTRFRVLETDAATHTIELEII